MADLFCYGSLMFAPVWSRVVRGDYAAMPATLSGWRRGGVSGEDYPGAVAAADRVIRGLLHLGVSADDLDRLDRFEGADYQRIEVVVGLDDGRMRTAQVYRYRWPGRLTTEDWSAARFEAERLAVFLAGNGLTDVSGR